MKIDGLVIEHVYEDPDPGHKNTVSEVLQAFLSERRGMKRSEATNKFLAAFWYDLTGLWLWYNLVMSEDHTVLNSSGPGIMHEVCSAPFYACITSSRNQGEEGWKVGLESPIVEQVAVMTYPMFVGVVWCRKSKAHVDFAQKDVTRISPPN